VLYTTPPAIEFEAVIVRMKRANHKRLIVSIYINKV
jgi:hypothetical protein